MFWSKKNKEENRYYLLPGMGRANRQKHRVFLMWGIIIGLIVSVLVAAALYFVNVLRYRMY